MRKCNVHVVGAGITSVVNHRPKSRRAVVAVGAALVLLAAYLYLFRTVSREDPGNIYTLHFRWGSLQKAGVDINKDGRVDIELSYAGWATDRSADDPISSAVASSNCDGIFDVMLEYSEEGHTTSLTFDADGDGINEVYDAAEGFRRMVARCEEWSRWAPDESDTESP